MVSSFDNQQIFVPDLGENKKGEPGTSLNFQLKYCMHILIYKYMLKDYFIWNASERLYNDLTYGLYKKFFYLFIIKAYLNFIIKNKQNVC